MAWSIKKPLGEKGGRIATGIMSGGLSELMKLGGTPDQEGPANPWSQEDLKKVLDSLKDTSEFNFLKTAPSFSGKGTTFSGLFKTPTGVSEDYFADLFDQIDAPSSVDQVRSEIEGQKLDELLKSIDEDTAMAAGKVRTAALEGGWGGPGMASDIESVGLGRAYGEGVKAKTGARLDFANKELDRQAAKEKALADALGLRYTTGANRDLAELNIAAQGAQFDAGEINDLLQTEASLKNARDLGLADILSGSETTSAQLLANLFNQGASNQIQGRKQGKPGIVEDILRNTQLNIGI